MAENETGQLSPDSPLEQPSAPALPQVEPVQPVDAASGEPTELKPPVDLPLTREERTNLGRVVLLEDQVSGLQDQVLKLTQKLEDLVGKEQLQKAQEPQVNDIAYVLEKVDKLEKSAVKFSGHLVDLVQLLGKQYGGQFLKQAIAILDS